VLWYLDWVRRTLLLPTVFACVFSGCVHAPTVMTPDRYGSIGLPSHGLLTNAEELPRGTEGSGYFWLRNNDRHYGLPRFVRALVRATAAVEKERPGSKMAFGDLSVQGGGQLMPHWSHRTGRDADLLLYMQGLQGEVLPSADFAPIEADGLAYDKKTHRFMRLDVERQWLLVRALVTDPEARTQWIFCHKNITSLIIQWAIARGEPIETVYRAATVLHQPAAKAGLHDDHLHVRTECTTEEAQGGCITGVPHRPWLTPEQEPQLPDDGLLASELATPLPKTRRDGVAASATP
jgi:penicillin-insensitive murein DD-endopeptidase